MATPEIPSSTFSAENINFFLLPKGIQRQQTRQPTSGQEMQVLNVYLTTQAVHLILEAEESILDRLRPDIDTDREILRKFNDHERLINELTRVRDKLNP